jgi:two-component system, NarL family, sensor histidine kinase DevS
MNPATAIPFAETPTDTGDDRWRAAAMRVQAAILSGADVDTVLDTVAETARTLVDGDVATLGAPRVPGQSLILRAASGYRADDLRGAIFPVEESLSGLVLQTRDVLHVTDATRNANAYQPICELGDMGPTLMVPLERGSEPFGTLLVARRVGQADFDASDLELLRLFAGHVAVAVEFCRGQEELLRLAELEETERVGRDLHDTVVQRLFATGLALQGMTARLPSDAAAHLHSVLEQLDEIVHDIRSTVLDPGPR